MRRNPASIIEVTEQEYSDLQGRLEPGAFYRVVDRDGKPLRLLTPSGDVVGGGVAYPGQVLGMVGDSITEQWRNNTDPTQLFTQGKAWPFWALQLSGCFVKVVTAARSGSGMTPLTAGVMPTFQTQRDTVIDSGVTHCTFLGGVNDIASGCTLTDLQAAATDLIDSLVSAGVKVYWCTIPPMTSTYGGYSAAKQSLILQYNDWIRQQAALYGKRVRLVDMYAAVVDPASKTSSFLASASADGLHPRNWGAYWMGKAMAAAWSADGVYRLPLLLASAGDARVDEAGATLFSGSSNILQNGLFNLGAPTGGVAANWTAVNLNGATNTASIVAAPGGVGNAQRLACTFSGAGQGVRLDSANFAARVNMTGRLLVSCRLDVAASVALKNIRVRTQGFGNVNATFGWGQSDPDDIALPEAWTGFVSFEHVLPPGITTLSGGFVFSVFAESSAAGSATVDVSQVSVRALAAD